jgi:hypothetical protein
VNESNRDDDAAGMSRFICDSGYRIQFRPKEAAGLVGGAILDSAGGSRCPVDREKTTTPFSCVLPEKHAIGLAG